VIGFPRTSNQNDVQRFVENTGINAIGLSQDIILDWAATTLQPKICVQGNLAPELLLEGGENMIRTAKDICEKLGAGPFVFNLGHGVIKETNPDHVATLINTVHNFKRT
jgi:uroporphyrinogen decarboxylase